MVELLHIFIQPRASVTKEQIEKQFNLATDWFCYADGCYLVFTTRSMTIWRERLKPIIEGGGYLLILKLDLHDYKGWMPKALWPWLKDKKQHIYGDD